MRKIVLAAALSASTLALAACSGGDEAADTTAADAEANADAAAVDTAAPAEAAARLDPNTATEEELTALAGMTPELAAAIVAGRPYASATAFNTTLMESLGEAEAATLRESLFVPVNLNTATEDDIKLIPGMTDRMVHEFMEYRPYEDMAEFDREIGKYVDAAEVARLRSYTTL